MSGIKMSLRGWKIFSVAALVMVAAVIAGSFLIVKNMKENKVGPSPASITAEIISEMHYSDMTEVSGDQLSKHYSIPEGVVTDSSLYMSKATDSASELACFLLTNSSKYPELQTAVANHVNSKAAGFKSLNPGQYGLLKNYVIARKGRYVLVSVGNRASSDEKLFDEILK